MKKLLLATTAVFALATDSSIAADLSRPVLKAAPMAPPCAAARFQGGYIGVSGGGVNYEANRTDLDGFLFDSGTNVQKKWGGIVGAQAGYNWTTCNTLWGIEVDGSWVGAKATTNLFPNTAPPGSDISVTSRFDTLVTGRVRTGVVLDNLLLYVTGGVAGGHFKTDWTNSFDGFATIKEWRWGWTAGFGTEWAWTPNVSLKSEVLYVDFVDRDHRVAFAPGDFASFKHSDSAWISRIGLNVKFGGPPVVAKY